MLKCAGNDDIITMKADDAGDTVTFMFENKGARARAAGRPRAATRRSGGCFVWSRLRTLRPRQNLGL